MRLNARSRYDYFYEGYGAISKQYTTYFLDLSGSLLVAFRTNQGHNWIAEGGVTANQPGKTHTFTTDNQQEKKVRFGYTSCFAGAGYDVKQAGQENTAAGQRRTQLHSKRISGTAPVLFP